MAMSFWLGAVSTCVTVAWGAAGAKQGLPEPSASEQVKVFGQVKDEGGRPVSGAEVLVRSGFPSTLVSAFTEANGAFSATLPSVPRIFVSASHPEFGLQFTAGAGVAGEFWSGYGYDGSVPLSPIELRLRRGIILRGRAVDSAGQPFGGESIFLIPAYVGSGPSRHEARTDNDGRFDFERMVLDQFALVPHGLDYWHPRAAGTYFRILQASNTWLALATADRPIELTVERYTLVPVTLDVSALRTASVQVWTRGGRDSSFGAAVEVDARGRVQTLMELGVRHELWVVPGTGRNMVAPWTRGIRPQWRGTPRGPVNLTIGS